MMKVDAKIAPRFDSQIEKAVFRQQYQHVIKKRNTGVNTGRAGSIDLQIDGYRSFGRCPLTRGATLSHTIPLCLA
jgi:hypothetical protein